MFIESGSCGAGGRTQDSAKRAGESAALRGAILMRKIYSCPRTLMQEPEQWLEIQRSANEGCACRSQKGKLIQPSEACSKEVGMLMVAGGLVLMKLPLDDELAKEKKEYGQEERRRSVGRFG